jgi:hypothetical protein
MRAAPPFYGLRQGNHEGEDAGQIELATHREGARLHLDYVKTLSVLRHHSPLGAWIVSGWALDSAAPPPSSRVPTTTFVPCPKHRSGREYADNHERSSVAGRSSCVVLIVTISCGWSSSRAKPDPDSYLR